MQLSFEKTITDNISHVQQPRRSQIYVGFRCHQKCGFCYYKHKCSDEMFSLDFVKKQIDFKYSYGIRDFEITGGEPGEYNQLRQVCEYIKTKDQNSKIAIITNGSIWKSNIWDVIDEVLVSYHLSRFAKHFNAQFFPLGSTYDKVRRVVDLAHSNNVLLRTNSVIGTFNLDDVALIDDLLCFRPQIINFLPLNLFDDASNLSMFIDYDKFGHTMDMFISKIHEILPKTLVFIRYVPMCVVEKHIDKVVGHVQHIYDWFDWNRELDGIDFLDNLRNNTAPQLLKSLGTYGSTSIHRALCDRQMLYTKNSTCLKCRYQLICDGIDKTQSNASHIEQYIHNISGPIVKDCLEYSKNVTYDYYHELYGQKQ